MILVEKHIINNKHSFYNELDNLCFLSKNIYNQALYNVRQHYFENKKYLSYVDNYHLTKKQNSYYELPTKVSCQTIRLVDQNFKSFFALLKKKNRIAKIPKYLHKEKGRYLTKFPKQAISIKHFKKTGRLLLSKTNIDINTRITDFNDIKEVRIVPRVDHYVIEVVYEKLEKLNGIDINIDDISNSDINNKSNIIVSSIDVGLNNLATVGFNNIDLKPFIINGKPLKSINQYYNKKKSKYQSLLDITNNRCDTINNSDTNDKIDSNNNSNNIKDNSNNKNTKKYGKTSKRIKSLTYKRNNKIDNYLHKASRMLVNQLVSNKVNVLVIGKNTGMKQDINIGKKNNQNFVQAPVFKFLNMVSYKSKLEGIKIIWQEESYTSKCSFLDDEEVKKHDSYLGKRIKRGLFRSSTGKLINSDLNGAYNIMKKAIPNVFTDGIEGFGVSPLLLMV